MANPIAYPLVNGVRHSFQSCELKIVAPGSSGLIIRGFTSLNYKRERKRDIIRGTHPNPLGKTAGENEFAADIEVYLAEFNLIQNALQVAAGGANIDGYGDVFFNIVFTYIANGFDPIVDTIVGCTWDSVEAEPKKGPEGLTRKATLNPLDILHNGTSDYSTPLTGAGQ